MRRSRRLTIAVVMLIALGLEQLISTELRLGTFGVISLALVAQLAPPLLLKLYWPAARAQGAIAGILVGTLLVVCSTVSFHLFGTDLVAQTLSLDWNSYSVACVFGLIGNLLAIIGVSLVVEKGGVNPPTKARKPVAPGFSNVYQIVAGFVGDEAATAVLGKAPAQPNHQYNSETLSAARKLLAGIVGSNVAERLLGDDSQREDHYSSLSTVQDIYQFGRGLLQSSIDNIEQGISVVDANLNLVAWNQSYVTLHTYPRGFIHVGKSVEELVRFNAERGLCGPGDTDFHVEKRLAHLRRGTSYKFTRQRSDGRVIQILGRPLPDGGFVTTYTDISDFANMLSELEQVKSSLERKVEERTAALQDTNELLADAVASKSRFLASASHDLVQPLNASKLFLDAIGTKTLDETTSSLIERASESLLNAEQLIVDMLQIARLDSGDLKPRLEQVELFPLLDGIVAEMQQEVSSRELDSLEIRLRPCNSWVEADRGFLRRILQNLIENAVKYTRSGRVLIGCRKRGERLVIEVWDNGIGIKSGYLQQMFEEFSRGETAGQHGYGLGLSTVKKLCDAMNFPIVAHSQEGKGSVFKISLPLVSEVLTQQDQAATSSSHNTEVLASVLVVDNEEQVRDAMHALLFKWGYEVTTWNGRDSDERLAKPNLVLMDYHLDQGVTGIEVANKLRERWGDDFELAFITAEAPEVIEQQLGAAAPVLTKPIRAAKLRALLRSYEFECA